jgi:hypothetical protein
MKPYTQTLIAFSLTCAVLSVQAQGAFQNLDFEAANLSPIPSGQYGGFVSSLDGIPGWTGFIGTNQLTQVVHNAVSTGNASIDILGPYWSFGGIIEGQYTVDIQPGRDPFVVNGQNVSASISQVGLVPANAQSLRFTASPLDGFAVSLEGQTLSLVTIGTGPYYATYGANISSFAGQTAALTFTALAQFNTTYYIDSIQFSNLPIPEPGVFGLSALGALLLGWRALGGRR